MQENRSFDHYFVTLSGVRGLGDRDAIRLSDGRSVFYQPDPKNPDGYLLPFHLDRDTQRGTIEGPAGFHLSPGEFPAQDASPKE